MSEKKAGADPRVCEAVTLSRQITGWLLQTRDLLDFASTSPHMHRQNQFDGLR